MIEKLVGARMRALRLVAGLPQAEVARRSGIHRPNIARIESGKHAPSLETVERFASAIGTTPAAILSGPEQGPDPSLSPPEVGPSPKVGGPRDRSSAPCVMVELAQAGAIDIAINLLDDGWSASAAFSDGAGLCTAAHRSPADATRALLEMRRGGR